MSTRSYLSIGDVLSLLREEFPDVTISKIRFLESQGLVDPERSPSGYRKFYEPDVERLRWVLRQQREHFLPLKVIRDRLAAAGNGVPSDEPYEAAADEPESGAAAAGGGDEPGLGWTSGAETVTAGVRATVGAAADGTPGGPGASGASGAGGPTGAQRRPEGWLQSEGTNAGDERGDEAVVVQLASERGPGAPRGAGNGHPAASVAQATSVGEPASWAPSSGTLQALAPDVAPPDVAAAGAPASVVHSATEPSVTQSPPAQSPPTQPSLGEPSSTEAATAERTTGGRSTAEPPPGGQPAPAPPPAAPTAGRSEAADPSSSADPAAPVPPAVATAMAGPVPAEVLSPSLSGVSLTLEELCAATGLSPAEVSSLESFGLVASMAVAGADYYDEEALAVARLAVEFGRYGIEPRHLRLYRNAVDREVGLVEQVVTPLLRQRNPEARQRAVEAAAELMRLGQGLRASLVRAELRRQLGT